MSASDSARAGFWRRVSASVLDVLLIIVTIQILGVWLANTTGGKVRVSSTLVTASDCTAGGTAPAELQSDFRITSVQRCIRSVFGIPYDWTLTVSNQERPGPEATRTVTMGSSPPTPGPPTPGIAFHRTVPLDSKGRVTDAFYLDSLTFFVLAAYVFLCEWRFGATVGKRLLGIRVRALGGTPIDAITAGRRILVRMVPILPGMAFAAAIAPPSSLGPPMAYYFIGSIIVTGLGVVLIIVFFANFVLTTSRRTLPWHDRFAQTEAVRPAGARAALATVEIAPRSS